MVALLLEDLAKVAVGFGEMGLELDCRAVFDDSLVEFALTLQGEAEAVVGFG